MPTPLSHDHLCPSGRASAHARAPRPTARPLDSHRRPRTYRWGSRAGGLALLAAGVISACDSKAGGGGTADGGNVFVPPPTGSGGRPGGAAADGGGERPTQVMEQGTATAKFCNNLLGANRTNLQFTVELGSQPVRLVADSGQCVPARGQPCVTIPAGAIKMRVLLAGRSTPVLEDIAPVTAGAATLLTADTDEQMRGVITIATLEPPLRCEDLDLGGADAGAP